jgi:hypothetical protein
LVRKLSDAKKARKATEAEVRYIKKVLAGVDPKWFKDIKSVRPKDKSKGPVYTDETMKATKLEKALDALDDDEEFVYEDELDDSFDFDNIVLYDPVPTKESPFGYNGRTVIMEQLVVSEDIQAFIRGDVTDINTDAIEKVAKKNGMLTLEQKGVLAALRGDTTLSEIARVI